MPEVMVQAYAPLKNYAIFEYEFPTVWKAIEETVRKHQVKQRNPSEVSAVELKHLAHRELQTDWIFSQSRSKYQVFRINDFPKRVYLQNRYQYQLHANRVIGGVRVEVLVSEEVERLKEDGSSYGFSKAGDPDPSIANDLLKKIQSNILALPTTNDS
jgi:hypothetical protein